MKPGLQSGRIASAAAAVAVLSGCFGLTVTGTTYMGRGTGRSSSQTSTGSGGTSGGIGAGASGSGSGGSSSSGTGTGSGVSSGGAGSTTGSSSGGSSTGFADGGYVFCTVPGIPTWLCTPGTYFCDPSDAGVCFQCLSDADCADQGRPTYDRKRPRCDLHSGVPGYQNFCQMCLVSADCAGNPSGPLCDISPNYPPAPIYQGSSPYGYNGYSSTEPPIVDFGFETCGTLQTDCRVDGGPICKERSERCEPDSGLCESPLGACSTDADCGGLFSGSGFPLEPEPYCVMGYCSSCLNGNCPGECLSNLQCSGLSPRCEQLDAGFTNDAGLPLGFCGCDDDAQCGDAGWICYGFCGIPCTAPNVPDCASLSDPRSNSVAASDPFCNPSTGLCEPCTSDQQCQADPASGGPICSDAGRCGCLSNGDCSAGQTCQAPPPSYNPWDPAPVPRCVPSLSRCTPGSCGEFGRDFCDWETGECLDAGPSFPYDDKPCLTDYDCALPYGPYVGSFCDPVAHACTTCNTNADCTGLPSSNGSHCFKGDAGVSSCGCLSDADCSGNPAGPICDTTASDKTVHSCGCRTPRDCQIDQTCPVSTGATFSACSSFCTADSDCQPGYACDPGLVCRAHCEGQPCPASEPACDSQGGVGQNGRTAAGPVPYIVWCYGCLEASECSSLECDSKTHTCGPCQRNIDCPAGEVCHSNQCLTTCDAAPCPAGKVCDTNNLVGAGPDLCYECVSPIDCPNGEGCSSRTQTCGRCYGPNAYGQPYFDCPPAAVCSSYWSGGEGVCLGNCDLSSCPADQPICAVLPALTPDHKYCFGCLKDSDCASFGSGAWCDTSVGLTFSCQLPH